MNHHMYFKTQESRPEVKKGEMKKCELCNSVARMYCDSDQANLCWDCDAKVHTANFLVAKHSRTLLCHACQSPTPWTSSGPTLGPTVSVCEKCVRTKNNDHRDDGADGDLNSEDDNDEEDGDNDESDDNSDDDDDGDNQVVPLSFSSLPPPPLVSTSSSSEESSSRGKGLSNSKIAFWSKRTRK